MREMVRPLMTLKMEAVFWTESETVVRHRPLLPLPHPPLLPLRVRLLQGLLRLHFLRPPRRRVAVRHPRDRQQMAHFGRGKNQHRRRRPLLLHRVCRHPHGKHPRKSLLPKTLIHLLWKETRCLLYLCL